MKKFLSAILAMAMVLSMAACGASEKPAETPEANKPAESTPAAPATPAEPAAPVAEYKTELNIAINANPPSLDVPAVNSNIVGGIGMHIFEPLFSLNADSQPTAVLADSYSVSEDGKVYTIKLRQGIKFHNGEEMKADDVVASMTRWLEKSGKAAPLLGGSTFEKVDD